MIRMQTERSGTQAGSRATVNMLMYLRDLLAFAFGIVVFWRQRAKERCHLSMLSSAALQDIGFSRADADRESGKPFWRA